MDTTKNPIESGLLPLPEDPRDFSHEVVFGAPARNELPEGDFFVSEPIKIKDQGQTDFCAGYAAAAVSEDQEHVELNGEYIFAETKRRLGGNAWQKYGLNLRDVAKTICDIGSIEQEYYPFEYRNDVDRDFIANPANWADDLKMLAAEHRKGAFFAVDGPYDTFDNIRAILWKHRREGRSVLTGLGWRRSWNTAERGVVPRTGWETEAWFGHAVKIFGQILLPDPEHEGKETLYLVVQNSWGDGYGDGGIFYFPREVVNSQFVFGAFVFKDLPKETAQYLNENKLRVDASRFTKLITVLANLFKRLFGIT